MTKSPPIRYTKRMNDRAVSVRRPRLAAALMLAILCVLTSACSQAIGWGVVLWPPQASEIIPGSVVPVYFKSNITKSYGVGVPGSNAKEELELWRVDLFRSAREAKKAAQNLGQLASVYGISTRDGLILRTKATNLADQVYRLRLDQEIKLLQKVPGETVSTAGVALPGDWYLAMADDGTRGYVFSNQLMLWDSSKEPRPTIEAGKRTMDAQEADLFGTVWRPDYFRPMVESGRIDLYAYQPRYGIFTDVQRKQIRVERPGFSKSYTYTAISKNDEGLLVLEPSGAAFSFTNSGDLQFYPPQADLPPAAPGTEPVSFYVFQAQNTDVRDVIAAEERRRLGLLSKLVQQGEQFVSEQWGSLIITRSARVTWAGKEALVPARIPADAQDTGAIVMDLFLSDALAAFWDGGFTIRFDGESLPAVRFVYRYTDTSLELAFVPDAALKGSTVDAAGGLAVDLYFDRYR